ncbi:MAG: ribosomal-protein-alanine N-acetyltransferase [Deltaproteobacteria bacterium]|nr:MAG: ribosomal-protein-alanine N-acetyltransferase [Deltaproteobacteria bacterium]
MTAAIDDNPPAAADGSPCPDIIRPMTKGDVAAVHALECSAQPDPWSAAHFAEELDRSYSQTDLCWLHGQLAGFICSWLVAGELQIQNVATAPAFRRQGVAIRLLAHVLQRAATTGFESAWLEVRVGNAAAIALYERFGFKAVARRPNYYPDGEEALVMCYRPSDHKG